MDRIVRGVLVEQRRAAGEADRILCRPPPGLRVAVPRSESNEAGLWVVDSPRKAEGLEASALLVHASRHECVGEDSPNR